jgi:hypothetical protein
MIAWLKKLFGVKDAPVVTPEVLFCKNDGSKLDIEKVVVEYSPYTGEPSTYKVKKSCPICDAEPETNLIIK